MSEIHKISGCDNALRKGDVMFIHGLAGDAFTTWRHGTDASTSWPHWVGQEFPSVGVWSLGYAASPTKWTRFLGLFSRRFRNSGHTMPLPDRALQVLDLMAQRGLGQRPILFVCHSLGGLLAKQILRTAADCIDHRKQAVFANTSAVLFLATPHAGADLASLVNAFRAILRATVSIEDLRAHDAHLRDLFNWYRHHSVDVKTVTYFETRDLFGVTIVNAASAHPGIGDDPVGLDEDHLSIARPRVPDAQVCGAVRDLLRNHVLPPPGGEWTPPPPSPTVIPPTPTAPRSQPSTAKNATDQRSSSRRLTLQEGFEHDVFISYSSRDQEWVRGELLKRIEQVGLRVFIDFRDFTRGAPSIKEIERGILTCRKTLLVLTPKYIESEWCEFEGVMAQTLSPANRDLRVIPLLKTPCEKPLYVGALTHIDFTAGADLDLAWSQLLTSLGAPLEPEPPKEPQPDRWFLPHPYPMPPNFTGRLAERAMLTAWLDADADNPLLSLRALGGFGKSALAWHWLTHDVPPAAWPRVVWWSFYEGDASFDHFLAETLHYLSDGKIKPDKLSPKDAVEKLLEMLHAPGTLLVLDGFERVLRAFAGLDAAYQGDEVAKPETRNPRPETNDRDCISPLAELFLYNLALHPNLRSKVLLTTRLCPRVLESRGGGLLQGCREEELRHMQPTDAVEFFRAQRIRGTHTEIEQACEPYGYHPLSLRLLAGLIAGDPQHPGDISAARRLDVSGDLVHRQHHALATAYDSLTPARQALLSRIACFRSPVNYEILKALAETEDGSSATLEADLRDLVARGLLHHDKEENRFDLHPIVRRYAYDRLAAPDRAVTHTRLRGYFAAVPPPERVTRLEDLAPVIELYHHTVRAGQFDEARTLFRDRLHRGIYYQLGAYQLIIDLLRALFPDGEDRLPRLKDEDAQGWTLNTLGNAYSLSGQPRRAVGAFELAVKVAEKLGRPDNAAIGLANLASMAQIDIGALRGADASLRHSIALCRSIKGELWEGTGHQELGRLLAYRGAYSESEAELRASTPSWKKTSDAQAQCLDQAYRALCELLLLRSGSKAAVRDLQSAIGPACRALELADEKARTDCPNARDYVRAHWLLGAAHRVAGHPDEAERHLHEALQRCRRISLVEMEADILIDLARLRAATGAPDEAQRLAEEALLITERSGYVLQGADAHFELAKLALARGDKPGALDHAQEARRLSTCDGPPDYTYKAAYDEAAALLAKLE